jgi:hypothetical protein
MLVVMGLQLKVLIRALCGLIEKNPSVHECCMEKAPGKTALDHEHHLQRNAALDVDGG